MPGPPPTARPRPRPTPAVYRRRRLAALAAAGALALLLLAAVRSCGGGPASGPPLSAEQLHRAQLAADPVELTVSVSGDLLIHSPVFARALELGGGTSYDFEPMLREVRPYVAGADLALCHLETPLTRGTPAGYPLFAAPAELADTIAATGWDACDTASNHSLDGGQEGVEATGRALDRAGVVHTGSFGSAREQREVTMLEAEGMRVALLAYTTDTNGLPLPERHSLNVATEPDPILAAARRAREQGADAVIVNVHWGSELVPEYVSDVGEGQRRFARRLARSPDIAAVVGQGPHVVQPIRWIAGKPVVFAEGNLLSNQGADAGLVATSQDGLIALLEMVVDGEGARVEEVRYVPVWVRKPDFTVLPIPDALRAGEADPATLRASYERTVSVAGRGPGVTPEPRR